MSLVIRNETNNKSITVEVRIQRIYVSKPLKIEHVYLFSDDDEQMMNEIDEKVVIAIMEA
ncbi:MAG: hypothetical protein ACKVE3_07005 [Dissulfuribacterales bacterium]